MIRLNDKWQPTYLAHLNFCCRCFVPDLAEFTNTKIAKKQVTAQNNRLKHAICQRKYKYLSQKLQYLLGNMYNRLSLLCSY